MKRIWIAGSAGSGKSYLSNYMGKKLNIPVYHRDLITWDEQDNLRTEDTQIAMVQEITKNESWIFEGARFTASRVDGRLDTCDTIINLNISRFICLYRAIIRFHKQKNRLKKNLLIEELQPYNWDLLKYIIYDFPKKSNERKEIFNEAQLRGVNLMILSGRKSVNSFIKQLDKKQCS